MNSAQMETSAIALSERAAKVNNVVQIIAKSTGSLISANSDLFVDGSTLGELQSREASVTIEEINSLFVAARSQMESSREALYEYLGRVYTAQRTYGDSMSFVGSALNARNRIEKTLGRPLWTEKALKKDDNGVVRSDEKQLVLTDHLLFVSTNGKQIYGSIRSKYKRLIKMAIDEQVEPSRFVGWVKAKGGVVKALANVVEREPTTDLVREDIDSVIRNYTLSATLKPTIELPWTETANQFSVVLVYSDPIGRKVHQVGTLKEEKDVQAVIRLLDSREKKKAKDAFANALSVAIAA
jgi:hypothetical protein